MSGEAFEVEFIDRSDRKARFLVRGVTPAFANGVRRAIIADVPTMSIDTVRMIENSSVMFDEQIAHRLGLVPLTTPEDEFREGESVTLALDVTGPETAYSGDIVTSEPLVTPADENIPIIELKEGQRLELEAEAVMGRGKDHAKHQGGVAVGYRHLQRVEVVGDRPEHVADEPNVLRGVIEERAAEHAAPGSSSAERSSADRSSGQSPREDGEEPRDGELVPTDEFDHDLSKRYPGKEVEVHDVPDAFVFHVETDGSMDVSDLVVRAVNTLYDRADELQQAVQL
jgi:DNA-directed RNA polymerase subunit D